MKYNWPGISPLYPAVTTDENGGVIMAKRLTIALLCIGLFFCVFGSGLLYSQQWKERIKKERPTFDEIRQAFYKHWKGREFKRGGWKQFKRWEWFAQTRLDADGYFNPDLNWKGWLEKRERFGTAASTPAVSATVKTNHAKWTEMGPVKVPMPMGWGRYSGLGRINCIAFYPGNPDIMWAGSPSGGLWRTTNGGQYWINMTGDLPNLGVSAILIHPQNPDIMYIATGDGDAWDTFSIGILKSTDGGLTWNPVGLNRDLSALWRISKLIMHPSDPETILAATRTGVFKTIDGGDTWRHTLTGNIMDLDTADAKPAVWYASAYGDAVYKSTDTGETWKKISKGLPSSNVGRIAVSVSQGTPSRVVALYVNNDTQGLLAIYSSNDDGGTWENITDDHNLLGRESDGSDWDDGQAWYDLTLAVDPSNPDWIYVGGINLWKNSNGYKSWKALNYSWGNKAYIIHVDQHAFEFHPRDSNTFFLGNDGGVYKSVNGGQTFEDISEGLAIHQLYRLGMSQRHTGKIMTGSQDNGTDFYREGVWLHIFGGDGMECAFDPVSDTVMYCSYQFGNFYRSTDSGHSWDNISNFILEEGAWVTPFAVDPAEPRTLYAPTNKVYKSTDRGNIWKPISGNLSERKLTSMAVAPSDSRYIYVSTIRGDMFRTMDGGENWAQVLTDDDSETITWLTVDPRTPTTIWRTAGGYLPGKKVYYSADGGTTWKNVSGHLPNIPVNCLVFDPLTYDIYIGTDLGVFYSPDPGGSNPQWTAYDTGLPNVVVSELEIHRHGKLIRAATYGRGLWEAPLAHSVHLSSPVDFSGDRNINKSALMTEYLDVLSWKANPMNSENQASRYRVYKLETSGSLTLLAEVDGNTHEYYVRKVENTDITYYISAVDGEGNESPRTAMSVHELSGALYL
jgi:photosystem II stability/assembly factor-like uncharacterized protein